MKKPLSRSRGLRGAIALSALAVFATACGGDSLGDAPDNLAFKKNTITVNCDGGVNVTTDRHEISNIVIEVNGEHTKYDDLSGMDWSIGTTGVSTVWVKSGDNFSGDGPGYGERFDCAPAAAPVLSNRDLAATALAQATPTPVPPTATPVPPTATPVPPTATPVPADDGDDKPDDFVDTNISVSCSDTGVTVTTSRHDISNIVLEVNGEEIKYDGLDGKTWSIDMAGVTGVWVKSAANHSGDGPGYGERFDCGGVAVVSDSGDSRDTSNDGDDADVRDKTTSAPDPADLGEATSSDSGITVTCLPDGVLVETTDHDISNIVIGVDGDEIKYDDLDGKSYVITHSGDITTVWVKSANNFSDDGPGYGERFDIDCNPKVEAPTPTPIPVREAD